MRSDGLGYRKIHKVLVSEKFNIGKSPTTVDHMIKKMDRRKMILTQNEDVDLVKIDFQMFRS